jgi:hypothetical protein
MVLEAIAIISGVLILALAIVMVVFAKWILWTWLTTSPELLDYRRDKRGRFRKVRRG